MDARSRRTSRGSTDRLWAWGLGVLVLGTSVVVAWISVWLVVPYLALIGWMLFGPNQAAQTAQGRRTPADAPRLPSRGAPGPSLAGWVRAAVASAGGKFRSSPPSISETDTASEARAEPDPGEDLEPRSTNPVAEPPAVEVVAKPVRKRKPRVPKAPPPPPTPVTPVEVVWERVGPNQFVRKEVPAPDAVPEAAGAEDPAPTPTTLADDLGDLVVDLRDGEDAPETPDSADRETLEYDDQAPPDDERGGFEERMDEGTHAGPIEGGWIRGETQEIDPSDDDLDEQVDEGPDEDEDDDRDD